VNVPGLADVRLNGVVLGFALAITVVTTVAFGLMAVIAVRFENARDVLIAGGKSSMTAGARRATSVLVGAEVAFAVVLLLGAGLILRTFAGLLAVDPGFNYERVMTVEMSLPADRYRDSGAQEAFYRRAFAALRALPEVTEVGTAAVVPLTGNNWTVGLTRADRPLAAGERPPEVGWQVASGGYFRALRIPLKAGRLFDDTDRPNSAPVVIVSEALASTYFPNETVVGKRVRLGDGVAEIIGVVGSIRRAGLRDEPRADMYLPFEQNPGSQTTLFIRTSADPGGPLAAIRRTIREIEPNVTVIETRTLGDIASESVRATRLLLWLLGVFAVMALGLAVVGIYGVMSYVVRQRTREIGTRIALGAQRGSIIWLVIRQGVAISMLGIAVGLAIGLGTTRFISSMLYATSAFDPVVLIGVPVVLMAATLVACWLPARRAAMVDPAKTLSFEA
jgi:putative ABC transport system permease protein